MINPHIFRAYDIRGIADPPAGEAADLTEETVYLIGKGTGTYLKQKYDTKSMAVGRDNRLTGEKLQKAFMEGVSETGIFVTDIGLSISPMTYWASCALDFDSAVNITASHNPKEYNGIKIVTKNAHSICGDELQEIRKLIEENKLFTAENSPSIATRTPCLTCAKDIRPAYIQDLKSREIGRASCRERV